jgi:hypothetical protein
MPRSLQKWIGVKDWAATEHISLVSTGRWNGITMTAFNPLSPSSHVKSASVKNIFFLSILKDISLLLTDKARVDNCVMMVMTSSKVC